MKEIIAGEWAEHPDGEGGVVAPKEQAAEDVTRHHRRTAVYLSGPMAGLPEWNHPAFHSAAQRLRAAGYYVLNPADYGLDEKDWATCLRRDLHDLLRSEVVAVLPGWEQSKGATLETDVARRLDMPIHTVDELLEERCSL